MKVIKTFVNHYKCVESSTTAKLLSSFWSSVAGLYWLQSHPKISIVKNIKPAKMRNSINWDSTNLAPATTTTIRFPAAMFNIRKACKTDFIESGASVWENWPSGTVTKVSPSVIVKYCGKSHIMWRPFLIFNSTIADKINAMPPNTPPNVAFWSGVFIPTFANIGLRTNSNVGIRIKTIIGFTTGNWSGLIM